MEDITIIPLGSRCSEPGASTCSTNFVSLLPVELQIGVFVLMSRSLTAAGLEVPFFQRVKLKAAEVEWSLSFRSVA